MNSKSKFWGIERNLMFPTASYYSLALELIKDWFQRNTVEVIWKWTPCFPVFFFISRSNWLPKDDFGICSSFRFQNTPYMLNLMKFCWKYCQFQSQNQESQVFHSWFGLCLTIKWKGATTTLTFKIFDM